MLVITNPTTYITRSNKYVNFTVAPKFITFTSRINLSKRWTLFSVILTERKNPAVYRSNLHMLHCSWQFTGDSFPYCSSEDLCWVSKGIHSFNPSILASSYKKILKLTSIIVYMAVQIISYPCSTRDKTCAPMVNSFHNKIWKIF